jgi:phosphoribosylamine--glycine ligase
VRALRRSPQAPELICAPGNAGIAEDATCFDVGAEDVDGLLALARDQRVGLTVVGPEAPLVAGLVDALEAEGLAAFGPRAAAARLEGSKAFAKEVMKDAGVPTASYVVFDSYEQAEAQMDCASYPAVLKADGLAAGKGVIIAPDPRSARDALRGFFLDSRFGEAGKLVVLEEHLEGEELSLLALCDGETVVPMASAQDFKRIGEGDEGPNTGGMGSYSPVPEIGLEETTELVSRIHRPVVDALRRRGIEYRGVLYAGLMRTSAGPKVLEFNCRFGDPETQAVLPRLQGDLAELLLACVEGNLSHSMPAWRTEACVSVVLASEGYPGDYQTDKEIKGLDAVRSMPDVVVFHAGTTAKQRRKVVTAGGRVLAVSALGPDLASARERAYDAVGTIEFKGKRFRSDIALRAATMEAGK